MSEMKVKMRLSMYQYVLVRKKKFQSMEGIAST